VSDSQFESSQCSAEMEIAPLIYTNWQ
jgi:hypothetical protein